jgi:hypothetical protein
MPGENVVIPDIAGDPVSWWLTFLIRLSRFNPSESIGAAMDCGAENQ